MVICFPKLLEAIEEKRRGKLGKGALFELVGHPPHSPDLAPSDYRLFPKLKEYLRGKKIDLPCKSMIYRVFGIFFGKLWKC